jgi:hypothetical protein
MVADKSRREVEYKCTEFDLWMWKKLTFSYLVSVVSAQWLVGVCAADEQASIIDFG